MDGFAGRFSEKGFTTLPGKYRKTAMKTRFHVIDSSSDNLGGYNIWYRRSRKESVTEREMVGNGDVGKDLPSHIGVPGCSGC